MSSLHPSAESSKMDDFLARMGAAFADFQRETREFMQESRELSQESRGLLQESRQLIQESRALAGQRTAAGLSLPNFPFRSRTKIPRPLASSSRTYHAAERSSLAIHQLQPSWPRGILDIPTELITEISRHLMVHEMCQFRLACRTFDVASLGPFGRQSFETINILGTTESLARFSQLSCSQRLSLFVKELHVDRAIYNCSPNRKWIIRSSAVDEHSRIDNLTLLFTEAITQQVLMALNNFRLRSIYIQNGISDRSSITLGRQHAMSLPHTERGWGTSALQTLFAIAFSGAIIRCSNPLTMLSLAYIELEQIYALNASNMGSLKTLQRLELTDINWHCYPPDTDTYIDHFDALFKFIHALPSLTDLRFREIDNERYMDLLCNYSLPRQLQSFTLHEICWAMPGMTQFIKRGQSSLRSLTLTCWLNMDVDEPELRGESWKDFFTSLISMLFKMLSVEHLRIDLDGHNPYTYDDGDMKHRFEAHKREDLRLLSEELIKFINERAIGNAT